MEKKKTLKKLKIARKGTIEETLTLTAREIWGGITSKTPTWPSKDMSQLGILSDSWLVSLRTWTHKNFYYRSRDLVLF